MWLHGRPQSTQTAYSADVARFFTCTGNQPLQAITVADVQAFSDQLAQTNPWPVWRGGTLPPGPLFRS